MNSFNEVYNKIISEGTAKEYTPEEQNWLKENGFVFNPGNGGYFVKEFNFLGIEKIFADKFKERGWAIRVDKAGKRIDYVGNKFGNGMGDTPAEAYENMLKQEYEINAEAIRKINELKKQFEEYQTKLDEEIMK